MSIEDYGFGHITIDGRRYEKDLVILPDGRVKKRKKKLSKGSTGHTPLSKKELREYADNISPAKLIVGTGMYGAMPVTEGAEKFAGKRGIQLVCTDTPTAVKTYLQTLEGKERAAVLLHLTC